MKLDEHLDIQFREATESAEKLDFDSMDIIWQKVEEKLDHHEPKRRSFLPWYWASAAAVVAGIGWLLWQSAPGYDEALRRQEIVYQPLPTADTPTTKRKNGKTRSVGVQPCHLA